MLYSGGEIPGVNQKFKTLTLSVQVSDLIGLVINYVTPVNNTPMRRKPICGRTIVSVKTGPDVVGLSADSSRVCLELGREKVINCYLSPLAVRSAGSRGQALKQNYHS